MLFYHFCLKLQFFFLKYRSLLRPSLQVSILLMMLLLFVLLHFYYVNMNMKNIILSLSNKKWAVCPNGRFIQGLYRNSGGWLHHIEEARCCKPNDLPSSYLHCYDKDVGLSFDNKGWSVCDGDYYMAGFYKGNCDKLYCIEKFKCCSMKEGDCKMADWWKAFDKKGWVTCDSSKHYITGLFRNNNWGSNDKIFLLEEAKCCPAPAPDQTMGSTCKTVDWWKVLDK